MKLIYFMHVLVASCNDQVATYGYGGQVSLQWPEMDTVHDIYRFYAWDEDDNVFLRFISTLLW